MTFPAPTPVSQGTSVFLPGSQTEVTVTGPVVLFTVPNAVPCRIEAVHVEVYYNGEEASGDLYELRLQDSSGLVLHRSVSALIEQGHFPDTVFLDWARTASAPSAPSLTEWAPSDVPPAYIWCSMGLPDLVMQGNSLVTIVVYRGDGSGASADVTLQNIATTYTRTDSGVTTTDLGADPTPLLIPAASS